MKAVKFSDVASVELEPFLEENVIKAYIPSGGAQLESIFLLGQRNLIASISVESEHTANPESISLYYRFGFIKAQYSSLVKNIAIKSATDPLLSVSIGAIDNNVYLKVKPNGNGVSYRIRLDGWNKKVYPKKITEAIDTSGFIEL